MRLAFAAATAFTDLEIDAKDALDALDKAREK